MAKSQRRTPGAKTAAGTSQLAAAVTIFAAATDFGLPPSPPMQQPPLMRSVGRAWGLGPRRVAPRSLGKDCACTEVGDGVGGKGVLAGVVARRGWAWADDAHNDDDAFDVDALGEDSSDKISSMHRGWTKPARLRKRLPQSIPSVAELGTLVAGSSTHKLSDKLIRLRLVFGFAGIMT